MVGIPEIEGNAEFYGDVNRDLLQLVCDAPEGPPRSLQEVRQRLTKEWLLNAWQDNPIEVDVIEGFSKRDLAGLQVRVRPRARALSPVVNEQGFTLEDVQSAVFSIRTQSVGDTSKHFLQFLIEDFKDFVGKRQCRPGVLIIDEFGAFGNKNVIALLTMARSARMGVILATQDIASLGEPNSPEERLILANTRSKVLMATDYPEEIGTLAGTKYQVEASIQHSEGEATGVGSARIQHAFKVDPNVAGKLRVGQAFIIRQRHQCQVQVAQIGDIPAAPPEQLPRKPANAAQQEDTSPKRQRPDLKL